MSGLELNKFVAAILIGGLVAMIAGKVTNLIYHPSTAVHHGEEAHKRGFEIAVSDTGDAGGEAAVAAAAPVDIAPLVASSDPAAGQALFKKCATCHTTEKGGANKVGPNLFGVVNASKGAHAGFSYSDAIAKLGGSWDIQALSEFLTKPKAYAPGTKMSFAGISKPEERAAVIKYLQSLK